MQKIDDVNEDGILYEDSTMIEEIKPSLDDDNDLNSECENIEIINVKTNNLSKLSEISEKHEEKIIKKKNGKYIIIGGILGILILSSLGAYYHIYNKVKGWDNYIYPGVFVNGKEISKITKAELKDDLKKQYLDPVLNKSINIKADDKDYVLNFSDLNPQYNIDEISDQAYNYKKDENMFNKYMQITNLFSKEENTDLYLKYNFNNDEAINSLVDQIASDVAKDPVDATFMLENGTPIVTDDIKGAVLNKDALIAKLKEIAKDSNSTNLNVEAPIDSTVAGVTGDLLRRVNGVIATFTTSDTDHVRLVNMGIAANDLNGALIFPGETFSFNDRVGDSLPEKGYLQSYAYIDNKSVLDYGGGVCQVSTTLYGTLLRANIMPTERGPHMMPIWYVPMGLDAAVYYGVMDLKFKNTYDAPLYIESYLYGESLTITIYGDKSLMNGLDYQPYSVSTGPLSADAYLNIVDGSGNVIETEYLHSDSYNSH